MRIAKCFSRLAKAKKKGFIPYITAGDYSEKETVHLLHTMVSAGANLLEVGIPFSDPGADGPIIERAHHRAVKRGVHLKTVLNMVADFRKKDDATPIVLMGYLNSIEAMGYETFASEAVVAGVDGVLIVDCPPEESDSLLPVLKKHNIDIIYCICPNTTDKRIQKICDIASGYIYYVSLKGVTGSSSGLDTNEVKRRVIHIRQFTSLPICVGFGIKDGQTASVISKTADAVIVGTALVKTLEEYRGQDVVPIIRSQVLEIRTAMDT